MSWVLIVTVIATSLQSATPHQVLRMRIPYDTQYTCQQADQHFDNEYVKGVLQAEKVLTVCERLITTNS